MHPVLVLGIVISGAIVIWGGYEAVNTLYEWHNDRQEQKSYEEYVKAHAEKGRLVPVTLFENDDDDDDDDQPLATWQKRDSMNSQSELRHRNINSSQESHQYELFEMERSLSSRRSLLERENAILLQQEAELERKRSVLQSKGNSITGVFKDDSDNEQNPFDYKTSQNSSVQSLDKQDPFVDQLENVDHISNNSFEDITHHNRQHSNALSELDGSWSDLLEDSADPHHVTK